MGQSNSDTEYNKKSGYFQKQREFQEKDLVFGEEGSIRKLVMWLIICDRDYRAKMAAWLEGKQLVLQPPASESDKRFRDRTMIYAVIITHD